MKRTGLSAGTYVCHVYLTYIFLPATQPRRTGRRCTIANAQRRWESWLGCHAIRYMAVYRYRYTWICIFLGYILLHYIYLPQFFLNIIYTCNQDWHTAGDDRPTNPPPKLEVEDIVFCCFIFIHIYYLTLFYTFNPPFQCYQCDSTHENCTENQMGEAVFCGDEMNGCLISRGDNPYKYMSVWIQL